MIDCDRKHIYRASLLKMLEGHPDRAKYGYLNPARVFVLNEWVYDVMEVAYQMGLRNSNFDGVF